MDYFQGVVVEYLRAKRSVFVNTECLIQLDAEDKQLKGRHWYCDAMAVDLKERAVYLCEVTYSGTMQSLTGRLQAWQSAWPEVAAAIVRDSGAQTDWKIQPWVFIPECRREVFDKRMSMLNPFGKDGGMPEPRITCLEAVVPWKYPSWDRKLDALEDAAESQLSATVQELERADSRRDDQ